MLPRTAPSPDPAMGRRALSLRRPLRPASTPLPMPAAVNPQTTFSKSPSIVLPPPLPESRSARCRPTWARHRRRRTRSGPIPQPESRFHHCEGQGWACTLPYDCRTGVYCSPLRVIARSRFGGAATPSFNYLVMSHVIAIANQKGGVGKTTTAINLGASLAVAEKRTLVVDIDPQGNASSGLGITDRASRPTIYDVLIGRSAVSEATVSEVHLPNLAVVASTRDLVGAEIELVSAPNRERILRNALAEVRDSYDYVLVDCPPSL